MIPQQRKKNGEKPLHFDDFSVLLLTFFQLNCYFWGEPTICDISAHRLFLPHCHRCPIAFIKKDWQRKKNGEKQLRFDDFSVLLLTFFSIKLLFWGRTRDW
jgi:hypothetical protein